MRRAEDVTFGTYPLNRASELRKDVAKFVEHEDATTLVLWRGKPLVSRDQDRLIRLAMDHPVLSDALDPPLFLGLTDENAPVFAHDISAWEDPRSDEEEMTKFFDQSINQHPNTPDAVFAELRGAMALLSPGDAGMAAAARAVHSWHQTHRFCSKCGAETRMRDAGWRRDCAACGGQHFPRTDPVVIVLVTHGNSVLLGRSPHWPDGMYSLLAGFVEPGETIETASRREVFEESGVRLGPVTYLTSQPWPFPMSLMFGTWGEAEDRQITLDPNELEDALWVTREELQVAASGDNPDLRPARPGSVARFILDRWLADDLA